MKNLSLIEATGHYNQTFYLCVYNVVGETCVTLVKNKMQAIVYTESELDKSLFFAEKFLKGNNKLLKDIAVKPIKISSASGLGRKNLKITI